MSGFGGRTKSWSGDPAPSEPTGRDASWKDFGSSMSAISFGFAATAILVSMFLVMAIFEHVIKPRISFLQSRREGPRSSEPGQQQAQIPPFKKLQNSPAVGTPRLSHLSVLMPGQQCPTYLAQPAPLPCPREGIFWPRHNHHSFVSS